MAEKGVVAVAMVPMALLASFFLIFNSKLNYISTQFI